MKRKTREDGLTDDEYVYGRALPLVRWLRRLWFRGLWLPFVLCASGPWRYRFTRCRWCRFAQPRFVVRTATFQLPRFRCSKCRRQLVRGA